MKYEKTKYEGIYSYQSTQGKRYRVRVRYRNAGMQKEHSKQGFKTLPEAKAYYIDMQNKLNTGHSGLVSGQNRTLKEQWESYHAYKVASDTWNANTEETNVDRFKVWEEIAHFRMVDISEAHVQELINNLYEKKPYSQETVKSYFKLFMRIINDAVADGYLPRNKFSKINYKSPHAKPIKKKSLELEDYYTFMRLAEKHMRVEIFTALYLATFSLRRGEIYGITQNAITYLENGLTQIDIYQARTAKYLSGKSVKTKDSNRVIVIDQKGTQLIKEQIERAKQIKSKYNSILHKDDFIFILERTGRPFYMNIMKTHIDKILFNHDLDFDVTPHMLRHTFSKYASASGVDSLALRNYMGHADVEMTRHYTDSSVESAIAVLGSTDILRKW